MGKGFARGCGSWASPAGGTVHSGSRGQQGVSRRVDTSLWVSRVDQRPGAPGCETRTHFRNRGFPESRISKIRILSYSVGINDYSPWESP